jgi:hypothetical protein
VAEGMATMFVINSKPDDNVSGKEREA